MIASVILLWCALIILVVFSIKRLHFQVVMNYYIQKLPGPPKLNVFYGNMRPLHDNAAKGFEALRKWGFQYFPLYKLWIGHVSVVNMIGPEDIEIVVADTKHNKKSMVYRLLERWLGCGLLTSTGNKWQVRRKILTPAFHFNILQDFILVFNEETDKLVELLKSETTKNCTEITPIITKFTMKTISETTIGRKLELNSTKEKEYFRAFHELVSIIVVRVFRPWIFYESLYVFTAKFYKELRLVKKLHAFTKQIIGKMEKKANPDKKRKRLAMLDLLLAAKHEGMIDDRGIREEVDTFIFEGHDTTAAAIGFMLMILANNQQIQDEILLEMKQILGDLHKKPTYNDLQQLKYMERCIKETLRLYPSVPYISRELGSDIVTSKGYTLKKGSIIQIHIYDTHRNAEIFPDPLKFDPDRFLPENINRRHPFAYIPFSAGPRNCIGQKFALLELKSVLCGILSNFVIKPVDTPESIVLVLDLILRTKDPVKIKLEQRIVS